MKIRKTAFALISVMLLVACEERETTAGMQTTDTQTQSAGAAAPLEQINPEKFRYEDSHIMDYAINDAARGTCAFKETSVTCTGEAAADVPNLAEGPFVGRPGAVNISAAGIAYTFFEGVPPAPARLMTGQEMVYADVKCTIPDESKMTCSIRDMSFSISGKDGVISTNGPLVEEHQKDTDATAMPTSSATDDYSKVDDSEIVGQGVACGAYSGDTVVEVRAGQISCNDAIKVMEHYRAVMHQQGGGNTLFVSFDDWACSSPTAGRSQQIRASSVCDNNKTGVKLAVP